MVDPMDGYWVNCDLDLWPHTWHWPSIFQGHISKKLYQRNCYLIDVKQNESKSVRYWADCMVLPFDHTHDLGLVVSRSKFEIALFDEWGWIKFWNNPLWGMGVDALIDIERKGCESMNHDHDCDLWVTMVVWVDVPYSDWGGFRRLRAVDISSWPSFLLTRPSPKVLTSGQKYLTNTTVITEAL